MESSLQCVAIIGAGTMGAGIAQLIAQHGCTVHLIDVAKDAVEKGHAGIARQLQRLVEKGRLDRAEREGILERIHGGDTIAGGGALSAVDLAIEAVVEDLGVKHGVFAALEEATPSSATLATNTSSLSVSRIGERMKDPSRVIGMHFFNPAPLMPLVEIVSSATSAAGHIERAFRAAQSWGKTPVRVRDTPGFIVNRVARGFYLEALRLLGEGVAGVDEIDQVMRDRCGFKMGPFELMDVVGLDVNLAVSTSVWEQMNRPARLAPHDIQRRLVARGELGRKSRRGFYLYESDRAVPAVQVERRSIALSPLLTDVLRAFATAAGTHDAGATEQLVIGRILSAILNEAGWARADDVADAADIETAMIKGTNYPMGPLAWAEKIGPRTVRGALKALNASVVDGRYEAAPMFRQAP